MRLVLKNFVTTIRNNPMIFALLIICEVVSVLVILFSQGVYQNYQKKSDNSQFENIRFQESTINFGKVTDTWIDENKHINYSADGVSTAEEFRNFLDQMNDESKCSASYLVNFYDDIDAYVNPVYIRTSYQSELGGWGLDEEFVENYSEFVEYGRLITQEEEVRGEYVCVVSGEYGEEALGTTIEAFGNKYKVVGVYSDPNENLYGGALDSITVPLATIPDEMVTNQVLICPLKTLTAPVWRNITGVLYNVYGEDVHPAEIPVPDETQKTFYKSIMFISIALSVLSAINLAILFRYILNTRKKSLAVFCLSGCTKRRAARMYISEIVGLSFVIFVICTLIYHYLIMPNLTFAFENIQAVYSLQTYLYIFTVFIISLIAVITVMVMLFIKRTPVLMLKKGGA